VVLGILATVALSFTLPSAGQRVWIDPSHAPDSVMVECDGGPPIHELRTARLWRSLVTGGGWQLIAEDPVIGQEGQPHEFSADPGPGAHFYVTTTNPRGESCASNVVYVPGSVVTGVESEPGPARDEIVRRLTFDVGGRLVRHPTAAGVYWSRVVWRSGRVETKRVVVLK